MQNYRLFASFFQNLSGAATNNSGYVAFFLLFVIRLDALKKGLLCGKYSFFVHCIYPLRVRNYFEMNNIII